ncbi:MAG: HTH domain-containing protein [Chloroflexi bacterium]|nr:HTH domain-containing protein [Chloroflexota bacterium]
MKRTDPPRQGKFAKLSPGLARFIESMGMYFENMGIPRIGGRILGVLMIAHEPLSAEDIGKILKVSRGSISTNMRALTSSGMVEKRSVLHDHTTYFVFSEAAMEQRMMTGIQGAMIFRKLAEQGLASLPSNDSARIRMQRSMEWSDVLVDTFQKAIAEWRARYPD